MFLPFSHVFIPTYYPFLQVYFQSRSHINSTKLFSFLNENIDINLYIGIGIFTSIDVLHHVQGTLLCLFPVSTRLLEKLLGPSVLLFHSFLNSLKLNLTPLLSWNSYLSNLVITSFCYFLCVLLPVRIFIHSFTPFKKFFVSTLPTTQYSVCNENLVFLWTFLFYTLVLNIIILLLHNPFCVIFSWNCSNHC